MAASETDHLHVELVAADRTVWSGRGDDGHRTHGGG